MTATRRSPAEATSLISRRPWLTVALLAVVFPATSFAQERVEAGWDLFQTEADTHFFFPCTETELQQVELRGVPASTFDFGGGIGIRDVGQTDTILERKEAAQADSQTIDVEIVALSLASVEPISLCGGPVENIFYNLNEELTEAATEQGQITVDFDPNSFMTPANEPGEPDPRLHVFIDVSGSVSGPIATVEKRLRIWGSPHWTHQAPAGALLIEGVNYRLNGSNQDADFFPLGQIIEEGVGGNRHVVRTTGASRSAPAASPFGIAMLAALLLLAMAWSARRLSMRQSAPARIDRGR